MAEVEFDYAPWVEFWSKTRRLQPDVYATDGAQLRLAISRLCTKANQLPVTVAATADPARRDCFVAPLDEDFGRDDPIVIPTLLVEEMISTGELVCDVETSYKLKTTLYYSKEG